MWNWLKNLWDCDDPLVTKEKCRVNVGRADVKLTQNDGLVFRFKFIGTCKVNDDYSWIYKDTHGRVRYEALTHDAHQHFSWWQERTGKTGMASVGDNEFVPICNVKQIKVKYSDHFLEFEVPR